MNLQDEPVLRCDSAQFGTLISGRRQNNLTTTNMKIKITGGRLPAILLGLSISFALSFPTHSHAQTTITNAPKWESSAAAGLTLTRGNSKTLLATANLQTQ